MSRAPTGFEDGDGAEVLARIAEPGVGLALWRRTPSPGLEAWLDGRGDAPLPNGRFLARPREVPAALAASLVVSGVTDAPLDLTADIVHLVDLFQAIAGGDRVDVRLEALRHDACWKFHRDHVRLRLLTTYLGPGTQVVAPAHAHRALALQRRYRGPLIDLPRHAVALFKGQGELSDGTLAGAGDGVVHRSPPIAGSGRVRLVLCLNQPSAASPPPWE